MQSIVARNAKPATTKKAETYELTKYIDVFFFLRTDKLKWIAD